MSLTRIITDIPKDQVDYVIAIIEADGGTFEKKNEADGEITIIAKFENVKAPKILEPNPQSTEEKWMNVARNEIGTMEYEGAKDNPRILEYQASTKDGEMPDSVPWCSSFVNFCIKNAGFEGTNSKAARSWLKWGREIKDFVPGCIIILKRGNESQGHVGFYVGKENGRIRLLGGNQSQKVNVASFDVDRVIGMRTLN